MSDLTHSMEEYILRAAEIQKNKPSGGIWFSLWSPGKTQTGQALLRRGYLESTDLGFSWPFQLSETGWSAYMQINQARRKSLTEMKGGT